jgi:hypothetical protein
MLSLEIGELGEAGFDLSLTGFDEFELGELYGSPEVSGHECAFHLQPRFASRHHL